MEVLERVLEISSVDNPTTDCPHRRRFEPTKKEQLLDNDRKIIDTLNNVGHESISLCICDPDIEDCPIVFASDGFCHFTGYDHTEIEGKSCRFLQGPGTMKADVDVIRAAIKYEVESYVSLLNYRKDGTPFRNHFFMSPIHDKKGKLLYFLGVQCFPGKIGGKENIGWGYTHTAGEQKMPKNIVLYDANGEIEEIMEETEPETEVSSNDSCDEETEVSSNASDPTPKVIECVYSDETESTKSGDATFDTTKPDPPGERIVPQRARIFTPRARIDPPGST